jgi:ATP-binding cassette subfamily F protein 3
LIGPNGSGKSTILKTIIGEIDPIDGTVEVGNRVEVAYFDQELSDLNDNNSVLDELWLVDPLTEAGRLRTFLARFGFRGDDVFKKVAVLSGGEKTKLALAKILFMPANLLIFDEPTNHLDLDSRQALEEALKNFGGTYVMVSHDRYFLDCIADRIAALEDGTMQVYQGNYSYFREKKEAGKEIPQKKEVDPGRILNYERFKKESQLKGRLKKEIRSTISKIQDYEKILVRLEKDVNFNIPKTDWEKLAAASREKSRVEEILLELYNRLDELKDKDAEYSDT